MSNDAILGLLAASILGVLSWIALMVFGLRERIAVLTAQTASDASARVDAAKKVDQEIGSLRRSRHDHSNTLQRHENRLSRLEEHTEIGPIERGGS